MLTESAPPVITAAMLDAVSRHLRLSTGFAGDQAADVEAAFRAAVSHLENSLGLCLVSRGFTWRARLDAETAARAPIAPVRSITTVSRVLKTGALEPVDLSFFRLDREATRSRFLSTALISDQLEFAFEAGFGADWEATPADLRRAALILAAEHFDRRHANAERRTYAVPHGVAALIQPWRPLRLGARA